MWGLGPFRERLRQGAMAGAGTSPGTFGLAAIVDARGPLRSRAGVVSIYHRRDSPSMKVSTRGRYAVRMMLDVAIHDREGPVSFRSVSSRQGISVKYMEQIVPLLVGAGFLKGVRGAQGGYVLVGEPSDYTVGMILRATEGSISPAPCLDGDCSCGLTGPCPTRSLWDRLDAAVREIVDNTTLQDLIDEYDRAGVQVIETIE